MANSKETRGAYRDFPYRLPCFNNQGRRDKLMSAYVVE